MGIYLSTFKYILCIIACWLPVLVLGQNYSQTVRGKVMDSETGQALVGATITLSEQLGAVSDENGRYRIEKVPVGRYQLKVDFIGYNSFLLPEVLVESGKETIHNIAMTLAVEDLEAIIVESSKSDYKIVHPLSVNTITVEETRRFPATFFDPARLMANYAGIVSESDQANGISVRGNSPNGVSWRLEGMEIVNPNHTPNAGTISDRVTQNGGGVNILSAQVLGTSNFYTGAFPSTFNNALAGVMDMRFREGNNEQHEFTIQAGLIGLDAAAEGPFDINNNWIKDVSYLVNYRYSTIGLLSAMGVPLGDEEITFQDLSFSVDLTLFNSVRYKIFGMGGLSENIFEAERDTSLWEFEKDGNDISFDSRMGAVGGLASYSLPKGGVLKYGSVLSGLRSTRTSVPLDNNFNPMNDAEEFDLLKRTISSSFLSFEKRVNPKSFLKTGFNALFNRNIVMATRFGERSLANGTVDVFLYSWFGNWRTRLSNSLSMNAGLHLTYFQQNEDWYLEPRLAFQWQAGAADQLSLAYGLHSQQQPAQLLVAPSDQERQLGLNRAHHIVLAYKHDFSTTSYWSAELFYQSLFDIPIAGDIQNSFSAINVIEGFYEGLLVNDGTGTNYGIELSYQKYLSDNLYFLVNGTYFESKYKGSDGVERDTRYNGNYITNFTGGKEWQWLKQKQNKKGEKQVDALFGVNLRVVYLGGFRDTPIDIGASSVAGRTIYIEDQAFELVQDAFFRTDLRVYYKRSKAKSSSTWALDIQNLTNKENAAFSYYDTQQRALVQKFQLGIIPILSYRVSF